MLICHMLPHKMPKNECVHCSWTRVRLWICTSRTRVFLRLSSWPCSGYIEQVNLSVTKITPETTWLMSLCPPLWAVTLVCVLCSDTVRTTVEICAHGPQEKQVWYIYNCMFDWLNIHAEKCHYILSRMVSRDVTARYTLQFACQRSGSGQRCWKKDEYQSD